MNALRAAGRVPTLTLFKILRKPLEGLISIQREQGDLAQFRFGKYNVLLLSHPELVKEVLVSRQNDFVKSRTMRFGKELMGEGLPATEGAFHRAQRKAIQPSFSHPNIEGYLREICDYADLTSNGWTAGRKLRIREEMMKMTLSMVVKVLFGADVRQKSGDLRRALVDLLDHFVNRYYMRIFYFNQDRNPLIEALDRTSTPGILRYNQALGLLDQTIAQIIGTKNNESKVHANLLGDLLSSRGYLGEQRLSTGQIHDELMTFLLAGHDTTATALAWSFYLLAKNSAVESKLQAELQDVVGGTGIGPSSYPKLEYARKVVKESMRIYPPAWIIGREAVRETEVGGVRVPIGTTVLMSQYVIHHDPRFYHDPEVFNPDRWTREKERTIPTFAYFPFGGGLRGCVGEPLAMAMAVITLATVELRWKLTLDKDQEPVPTPRVTLHPKNDIVMVPRIRN